MKKLLFLLAGISMISTVAIAESSQPVSECYFFFSDTPQFGVDLTIVPLSAVSAIGTWRSICSDCSVPARNIATSGGVAGVEANYEGQLDELKFKLHINLESFAPTTHHTASLTLTYEDKNVTYEGSCTSY